MRAAAIGERRAAPWRRPADGNGSSGRAASAASARHCRRSPRRTATARVRVRRAHQLRCGSGRNWHAGSRARRAPSVCAPRMRTGAASSARWQVHDPALRNQRAQVGKLAARRIGVRRQRIAVRRQLQRAEAEHRHRRARRGRPGSRCAMARSSGRRVHPPPSQRRRLPAPAPRRSRRRSMHSWRSATSRRGAARSCASRCGCRSRTPSTGACRPGTARRRAATHRSRGRAAGGSSAACACRPTTGGTAAQRR